MKNYKSLLVLDRFRGLFEKAGVDYAVMRRILQVKLMMDARRVPTLMNKNKGRKSAGRQETKDSNNFLGSLWMYSLFGAFSSPFILLGDNYIFQMSLLFGIFIFMTLTALISDFSSVLLDMRDRNILGTKPIERKTISMAKTVHVFIYMVFLTGAIGIIPFVVGLLKHGVLFSLLFLLTLILMDLLVVVLTALLYLAVLRFFDGEKLKDMINYVQIGFTIVITIGYQLLIRLFDVVNLDVMFQPKWWQVFVVPVWFGAPFEVLLKGSRDPLFIGFTLLALLVPILAILLYIKLMPSLEGNLQKLADPGERSDKKGRDWKRFISGLLPVGPQEKAFFRFAWTMIGNEREFKLKVYPSLGFSLIFPFIFIFTQLQQSGVQGLSGTKLHLFIYFCALFVPTIIMMLRYSGKHKAAWIYHTAPIAEGAAIHRGTIVAGLTRLVLPLYMLESLIFTLLFGVDIILDLVVFGFAILLYSVISFAYFSKALPFSQPFEAAQQSEGMRMIPLMLLLGVLGGVHWAATFVTYGVYIYLAILLISNGITWKYVFSTSAVKSK
ncbi:hypothetical protein [Paenibacillus lentus]|uniref:Uncharacterized protein n=1 Tax=Paenibacillus lentus TaxID=1338368 RepID=A0A3Q8S9X5_9BACL|nr:hypothetical protein [Paenibacillus lentus]AZK45795.1 hypothetical protein EIM92_05910 [Paenibacillus lentus]